jgi:hypothetical protein
MSFLQRIFKAKDPIPAICPNSEYLSSDYWCDLGSSRVRIASLSYTYGDIGPEHAERVCKGKYKSCPLYLASRFSR